MDKLTYITTYYDDKTRSEAALLDRLLKQIKEYNSSNLKLIIVDDSSPGIPAKDVVKDYINPNISLFRVKEDIGFNSHGARNLAMTYTTTEWNLLVDIDYEFVGFDSLFEQLGELEKDIPHHFPVTPKYSTPNVKTRPSINDFLITKTLFWKVGGYDSELFGFHAGDREFMVKISNNNIADRRRPPTSVVFDCSLHSLHSPYAEMIIQDDMENQKDMFYDRSNNKLFVTTDHKKRLDDAVSKWIDKVHFKTKSEPIPFEWELVNFNITEEENDNEER